MDQIALDLGDSEEENRRKRIEDAKAKVKAMAQEARDVAKDERTYKRFGEPITRGGSGAAGVLPKTGQKKPEYRKGGYVKAADGIAQRGKTRGRIV
jgi:hypothetical protein